MNPKSTRSYKPQIFSKVVDRISAQRASVWSGSVLAESMSSGRSALRKHLETIQLKAQQYAGSIKPSSMLQAKKNVYQNIKKKDLRAYKKQKARQLLAIFADYEAFQLESSNSLAAKLLLVVYHTKLELASFVHQLSRDFRDLSTAVY